MSAVTQLKTEVVVSLVATNFPTRWPCHVCGGCTEKISILCEVEDGDHKGFRVCERCIEDGGIDEKLLKHVEQIEGQAAELRDLVGRLRVPSAEEYHRRTVEHEIVFMLADREVALPDAMLDHLARPYMTHQPIRNAWYDWLRIHNGMTREQIDSALEARFELHKIQNCW